MARRATPRLCPPPAAGLAALLAALLAAAGALQPGGVVRVPKRLAAERLGLAVDEDIDWETEYGIREARRQTPASQEKLVVNFDISAREVRLVGVWNDVTGDLDEVDEVLDTRDALDRAQKLGLDLVCDGVNYDPPHAYFVLVSQYPFVKARLLRKESSPHKVKETRLAYNVGDADLMQKAKLIQRWVREGFQVRVRVLMPGTTNRGDRGAGTVARPLEKRQGAGGADEQAQRLVRRVREVVAEVAKAPSATRGGPAAIKDLRGDLVMMLSAGSDPAVLKTLGRQGRRPPPLPEAGGRNSVLEWTREMSEGRIWTRRTIPNRPTYGVSREELAVQRLQQKDESKSVEQLEEDMAIMRAWLLKCGFKRHEINEQEEIAELHTRLAAARAREEASA
ncbi:unnamed protein product [Prorocentrum cordatum]|uniref:Uncharacterized protein n=1 Tax=Prorocentrum cordatum TaxID=2364126 RepID=A0ABN9TXX3_9DINO|nr:unnamed protein product [Polarella glacialis]